MIRSTRHAVRYSTVIIGLLLFSCQRNTNQQAQAGSSADESRFPAVNEEFDGYLKQFKKLELPVVIKGCRIDNDQFTPFDGKRFAQYGAEESALAYGQIPTNGNYIATITLGAADCYLPVLTTYKLNGKVIDKQTIAIGGCGSDCGFSCEEFMTLRKDFSFYTSDTISMYDCDSLANEIPGTYTYYVIYQEGRVMPDGKIKIGKEIKQLLPGRKEGA